MVYENAEDTTAPWQLTNSASGRIVDPCRHKPRKVPPVVAKHAERCVKRTCQASRIRKDPLEDRVRIELGEQRLTDVEELTQRVLLFSHPRCLASLPKST